MFIFVFCTNPKTITSLNMNLSKQILIMFNKMKKSNSNTVGTVRNPMKFLEIWKIDTPKTTIDNVPIIC